eukprot:1365965-Prymnesium_polylepis.1
MSTVVESLLGSWAKPVGRLSGKVTGPRLGICGAGGGEGEENSTPAAVEAFPLTTTCARAQSPGLVVDCGRPLAVHVSHEAVIATACAICASINAKAALLATPALVRGAVMGCLFCVGRRVCGTPFVRVPLLSACLLWPMADVVAKGGIGRLR